jgi:hypothetical protein
MTTASEAAIVPKAALEVLLRMNWTLSCPRWAAAEHSLVEPSSTTAVLLEETTTAATNATSSLGSVARLAALLHGLAVIAVASVVTATLLPLLLGLVVAVVELLRVALMIRVAATATAVQRHGLPPLRLLEPLMAMETTELVTTKALQVWVLPAWATALLVTVLPQQQQDLLQASALYSRTMVPPEAHHLHPHRHLVQCHHRLLRVTFLLLPRLAMSRPHLLPLLRQLAVLGSL